MFLIPFIPGKEIVTITLRAKKYLKIFKRRKKYHKILFLVEYISIHKKC